MLEKVTKFIKHNSFYEAPEINQAFSFLRKVEIEYSHVLRTNSHEESIKRAKGINLDELMRSYEFNHSVLKKVNPRAANKLKIKLSAIECLSNSHPPKGYLKHIIYSPCLDH